MLHLIGPISCGFEEVVAFAIGEEVTDLSNEQCQSKWA